MHPVAALQAFHGDPGSHDLGEAVDVQRLDPQGVFDLGPHLLAPGFGAEDPDPEFQGFHVDPHLLPLFSQVQGVGGGAADRRRAEVLEDHDLPFRVAAGHGNDARPQLLGPVVGPEAAGEQAVAVGVVEHIVLREPRGHEAAGHQLRPGIDVPLGVSHHGRPARRPGGGVQTDDAAHRNGEQAEGVVVPEVLLRGKGELFEIVQGFDVVRLDAGLVEGPPVKAHGMVDPLNHLLEPLELQGLQHLTRQCFKLFVVDHETSPPLYV